MRRILIAIVYVIVLMSAAFSLMAALQFGSNLLGCLVAQTAVLAAAAYRIGRTAARNQINPVLLGSFPLLLIGAALLFTALPDPDMESIDPTWAQDTRPFMTPAVLFLAVGAIGLVMSVIKRGLASRAQVDPRNNGTSQDQLS